MIASGIVSGHFMPTVTEPIYESVGERVIYYRLGESEVFAFANKHATIGGENLVNVIPLMVVEDHGFLHVEYSQLDKQVQYELFEGPRYRLTCRKKLRESIDDGSLQMVYSEKYKIPTSIPYIIQGSGRSARVFVNVSDFLELDALGKYQIPNTRNYNALMAILMAGALALHIVRSNQPLPADFGDGVVLMYAAMVERCVNSIVNMDPIGRDKLRYLAAEFALIQMYGTETGQKMFFTRFKNTHFPKLSRMVTESLDAQFQTDCFDRFSLFVMELARINPSMKGLEDYMIYEKWIRLFGSSTTMSIDYIGYHLYTICMVLFESPLISRMALEPMLEKNRGADMYKRMQQILEN